MKNLSLVLLIAVMSFSSFAQAKKKNERVCRWHDYYHTNSRGDLAPIECNGKKYAFGNVSCEPDEDTYFNAFCEMKNFKNAAECAFKDKNDKTRECLAKQGHVPRIAGSKNCNWRENDPEKIYAHSCEVEGDTITAIYRPVDCDDNGKEYSEWLFCTVKDRDVSVDVCRSKFGKDSKTMSCYDRLFSQLRRHEESQGDSSIKRGTSQ